MKPSKKSNTNKPFSKSEGFKLLGIGKQEVIKYFFGGNATLAIIIIAMIILFLIYHSYSFFPQYRSSLTQYRKSGQEFADYSHDQLKIQKKLTSLTNQAREYEIEHQLGALYRIRSIHSEFKSKVLKEISYERKLYKRTKSKLESLKDTNASAAQIAQAEQDYQNAKAQLKAAAESQVSKLTYADVSNRSWKTDDKYLKDLRQSVVENILSGKTTAFIANTKKLEKDAIAKLDASEHFKSLKAAQKSFRAPQKSFQKFVNKLRKIASTNKSQVVTHSFAEKRKAALEKKESLAHSPEDKARARIEAARILTTEPDYSALNQPLYDSRPEHQKQIAELSAKTAEGFAQMPDADAFQGRSAKRRIEEINEIKKEIFQVFKDKTRQIQTWNYEEPVKMAAAITGFFFGTQWVTNSSWQDFYGILPLLAGSVAVALIAVCLAIPFAVGGAIYINRLASPFEQRFIKPIIEFIGAIPSIVLAFFGVVVLGELIQENSQSGWLSWIPGFPVEGRLTIFNAGLLLAFMSIPTIFTLAEDALNNVPKAYKEASLSLGATHLQTVMRVILPSCSSGIIAAVLLGFGRIIGETMVVLLVMGGRIAIPTSFTDPAHSMTGILAQEIGEVDEGSLHWGALFMVGLVLFIIALTLNYIAQTTLRKLGNK